MAVNALVTGLIVFKILKVSRFLEVRVTSIERTLSSTGDTTLRNIIFVIIESGMALFAIQLVRVLLSILPAVPEQTYNFIVATNEMFNVIIRSIHFYFFVLLITFTWLGHHTNNNCNNSSAGLNEIVL